MRCMITASRRARATIAFFIPRRLAICMAHALSQDHFLNASCSEQLRRASSASSHRYSAIFRHSKGHEQSFRFPAGGQEPAGSTTICEPNAGRDCG
jgi:hypothetical protein